MWCLYFLEVAKEHIEGAEALTMFVIGAKVDDPARFWLPADDANGNTSLVSESSVKCSHGLTPAGSIMSPTVA